MAPPGVPLLLFPGGHAVMGLTALGGAESVPGSFLTEAMPPQVLKAPVEIAGLPDGLEKKSALLLAFAAGEGFEAEDGMLILAGALVFCLGARSGRGGCDNILSTCFGRLNFSFTILDSCALSDTAGFRGTVAELGAGVPDTARDGVCLWVLLRLMLGLFSTLGVAVVPLADCERWGRLGLVA